MGRRKHYVYDLSVQILGVTLDKNLSMNNHDSAVCKSIHYHIRALCHIRFSISEDMAKMVACAGSRLDYSNSVLFGATQKNISKLQKAQNLLAQSCSPRTLLQQLHWLPIKHRIDFKIASISGVNANTTLEGTRKASRNSCKE